MARAWCRPDALPAARRLPPQGLPKRRRSRSAEKAKAATGGNGEYLAGGKRSAASGHSRIRVRRTEAGGGGELLKLALCWRRSPEAGRKNSHADGGGGGRTESGPPAGKRKPATGRVAGWWPGKGRGWRRILFASKYPASKIYKTKTLSYQDLSTFPLTASFRFS